MTEPTRIRSAPECQVEEHGLCDGNQGIVGQDYLEVYRILAGQSAVSAVGT